MTAPPKESISRKPRNLFLRGLMAILLVLIVVLAWKNYTLYRQDVVLKEFRANKGNVSYKVIYPKWVTALGLEDWLTAASFRKITYLSYRSDADLNKMMSTFNLRYLEQISPQRDSKECTSGALLPLSRFPHLKYLGLYEDFLTPEFLGQLSQQSELIEIQILMSQVDEEVMQQIIQIPNLQELYFARCHLTPEACSLIPQASKLRRLYFHLTNVPEDLNGFSKLQSLDTLSMEQAAPSSRGLEELAQIPKLVSLKLGNITINHENIEAFMKLMHLRHIIVKQYDISDAELTNLLNAHTFRVLNLSESGITDKGLEALGKHRSLEYLNLNNTEISGTGLEHLATLPDLNTLEVAGDQIGDLELEMISKLLVLRTLTVDSKVVSENSLTHLKYLGFLKDLHLKNMSLSPQSMKHLAELNSLFKLTLTNIKLSDAELELLGNDIQLNQLYLNNCQLSEEAIVNLKKKLPRCVLFIDGKEISQ